MSKIGSMPYKITGSGRDGRYDFFREEWHLVRMPPMFFTTEVDALEYLESLERGIMWKRNDEENSRNKYSIVHLKATKWPEGARGRGG